MEARVMRVRLLCVALSLMVTGGLTAAAPPMLQFDENIAAAKAQMLADPEKARDRAIEAQEIAQRDPSPSRPTRIATSEWLQAEALVRMNEFGSAGPLIDRALSRLTKGAQQSKLLGDLMSVRAGVHEAGGDVAGALTDYQRAHNIFQAIGEIRSQSIALISIGSLYQTADDNESALKYYSRALDIYQADPTLSISVMNSRGIALKDLRRYSASQRQFEEALKLARQMGGQLLQARVLGNIARLQIARSDLSKATTAINYGLELAQAGEAANWRPQLYAIAAEIALARGDDGRARSLIEQAFAGVNLQRTSVGYREAHYTAYAIYRRSRDLPNALIHLQAMKRLDDQVWKLTASTNTALMAARFDSANQEARIAKLKADESARELAMAQAETRFQRIIFVGVTLSALAVLGLLGFYLWQSRRARLRLATSNAALEKALAAKTEFLATTSHEIRTPLNGILGMTQVMLADRRLDAALRERVGIVHDAGLTMRGLVDDILDVAKMETGNLVIEARPFDLRAMLEDVTRIWGEQARTKGLEFRLEVDACPRGLIGDAGRVRQVIYNLLSNAVKFTAAGVVRVTADCHGDRLTIAVADSGIGIPAGKHSEIFESFKQADGGTTRQFGGTGLGLAIVRNIVAAMGGTIRVESVVGEGATFTVDLPFVPAELTAADPIAAETGGLLIVDRNPIARALLKAVLEPRAGRIAFADSCGKAMTMLERERFARVLVDDATAAPDGADPIAAIAPLATVARVALLWTAPDDPIRRALAEAGVDQVIAKPVAGPALASALYACNTQIPVVTQAA